MDSGDLASAAALFCHARIKVRGNHRLLDGAALLEMLVRWKIYPCGTPRTRHVISNPIIEIDTIAGTATERSCYTVFQAIQGFPLQAIASGRYHDKFELAGDGWRFCFRDYSLLDLVGDLSRHLNVAPTG